MKKINITIDGVSYPVPFGTDVEALTAQLKDAVELGRTVVVDMEGGSVLLVNGRCASSVFLEVRNEPGGGPPSMSVR